MQALRRFPDPRLEDVLQVNAYPLIFQALIVVVAGILLGSALSFLGLGPQPPASEWGLMISDGRGFITAAPWIAAQLNRIQ